jgi:hypothetical protein
VFLGRVNSGWKGPASETLIYAFRGTRTIATIQTLLGYNSLDDLSMRTRLWGLRYSDTDLFTRIPSGCGYSSDNSISINSSPRYTKLTDFITLERYHIFRKFKKLASLDLLYRQTELVYLEKDLKLIREYNNTIGGEEEE